jgi:hypothetical protein
MFVLSLNEFDKKVLQSAVGYQPSALGIYGYDGSDRWQLRGAKILEITLLFAVFHGCFRTFVVGTGAAFGYAGRSHFGNDFFQAGRP